NDGSAVRPCDGLARACVRVGHRPQPDERDRGAGQLPDDGPRLRAVAQARLEGEGAAGDGRPSRSFLAGRVRHDGNRRHQHLPRQRSAERLAYQFPRRDGCAMKYSPGMALALALLTGASWAAEVSTNGTGGGPWSDPATWKTKAVPAPEDDVVI